MKSAVLTGTLTLLLSGGVAFANGVASVEADCPEPRADMTEQERQQQLEADEQAGIVILEEPADPGAETMDETGPGVGGSGPTAGTTSPSQAGTLPSSVTCQCQCPSGMGGSGDIGQEPSGSMEMEKQPDPYATTPEESAPDVGGSSTAGQTEAFTPPVEEEQPDEKADMRGVTVSVGSGIEGFTGSLAPAIDPGLMWSATAALRPTKAFGFELGYSGALHEVDIGVPEGVGGITNGADLVRNGGHAVVTLGLTPTPVQPYLLGGIGFSNYNARGTAVGLDDDVAGHVPFGAGLRTHIGNFTADARFGYNFLFDQGFLPAGGTRDVLSANISNGGQYQGTLNLGATF